jgi:uncharacterized protein (TIRG00374 family)
MKKLLQYILPLSLAMALMYWVFKGVDIDSIIDSFKGANYFLVFFAGVCAFLANLSRAIRWNIMMEPLGYKPSIKNTTIAVLIGYMTNLILPRAGEFARSASLQKSENVPFQVSFGAVIAERIIDLVVAICLLALNIFLEFNRIKDLAMELFGDKFHNPFLIYIIIASTLVFFFLGFYLFDKNKGRLSQIALFKKSINFLDGLKNGFLGVFKIEKLWQFIFHTFCIWMMYYVATYFLCQSVAIGSELSHLAILTILVMGSVGMAIPTIGGIGSYHLLVGKIVVLYGLTNQEGINLATFLHTMQGLLFVLFFGLIALVFSFLSTNKHAKA